MGLRGGRTWWAHFEFTRTNIKPTILRTQVEDWIENLESVRFAGAFRAMANLQARPLVARRR